MTRSLLVLSGLIALSTATAPATRAAAAPAGEVATAETTKAKPSEFEAVAKKIRELRKSGAWQQGGWKDADLEESLQRLIASAQKAAGRAEMQVGVRLAGLQPLAGNAARGPGAAAAAAGRLRGVLQVSGDASITSAEGAVLLVDGSVHVSFATDSVIIASGAVDVSHGRRNLIIAGHYLQVSHDGDPRARRPIPAGAAAGGAAAPPAGGSLLISGGVLRVSHATESICAAPTLVRVSHANGVAFINSPKVEVSNEDGCQRVNGVALPLAPAPPRNPLEGKLNVTQTVARGGGGDPRGSLAIIEHGPVELVVRPGRPILDGTGKPMPGLDGWSLSFVNDEFALFSNGELTARFFIPPKP